MGRDERGDSFENSEERFGGAAGRAALGAQVSRSRGQGRENHENRSLLGLAGPRAGRASVWGGGKAGRRRSPKACRVIFAHGGVRSIHWMTSELIPNSD